MIAGRLRWREPDQKPGIGPRLLLASFVMSNGTLLFTEASSRKRASMQLVRGAEAVRALDRGGIEPLEATVEMFREALTRENHTLKRGLTDPRLFSGIGNAYSDEILHAARLSPLKLTRSLSNEEVERLHGATRDTLLLWIDRLRQELSGRFPGEGHRLPRRDGRPRPIQTAVSRLRRARPAHRVRGKRVQLLREVPDGRTPARRSVAVAAAPGRLAEID